MGVIVATNEAGQSPGYTENGYQNVSMDTLLFTEQVDGSNVNINLWTQSVLTQTIVQATGFITLNSGLSTTVNTYAILTSNKAIPSYGHLPLVAVMRGKVNIVPLLNATIEFGLGAVSTNAAPTDGAFFRWKGADATFRCVINNGGVETESAALNPPSISNEHIFEIDVVEDLVTFFIDDAEIAAVAVPTTQAYPFNAGRQTVFCRTYNGASIPTTAPAFGIGQINVMQQDLNQNKLWKETLVSLGRGAYQSPVNAFAQSANHANSTDPVAATLSNTAAGYGTLGGRWTFAAVAGAATDYALFAYQVPVGYQLIVSSVALSALNLGAAVATTPTIFDWSLGVNSSAVSLATVDGVGTIAPRRIPLGLQSFVVGAAIGAMPPDLVRAFDPPLIVDGGRFLQVILEIPIGTATGSETFRGDAMIGGYFE